MLFIVCISLHNIKQGDSWIVTYKTLNFFHSTTFIVCPADPKKTLGIKLPFLVMIIKNMKKYFTFEVMVSFKCTHNIRNGIQRVYAPCQLGDIFGLNWGSWFLWRKREREISNEPFVKWEVKAVVSGRSYHVLCSTNSVFITILRTSASNKRLEVVQWPKDSFNSYWIIIGSHSLRRC